MKHLSVSIVATILVASLVIVGCSQAAPAATPTQAPAAKPAEPTKATSAAAAAPTAAPVAQPTAAPAKKVDFPAGKPITVIVPWPAGGPGDVGMRVLAPPLEKEIGVPISIVNKGGAASQVGNTELVQSKPDGYTLGYPSLPTAIMNYLDPERKAIYTAKSFQPIANQVMDPSVIGVKASSPYKTVKDLIDAAKANPEKIKVGTAGAGSVSHLTTMMLGKQAGVKFALVHFQGGAPALTAMLGGHVDAVFEAAGTFVPQVKSGEIRILGVMDKEESKFFPGVKTFETQGYPIFMGVSRGVVAPAGVPKEIVDVLGASVKRAIDSPEHKKKLDEMGLSIRYLDAAQYTAYWADLEKQIAPFMDLIKQ